MTAPHAVAGVGLQAGDLIALRQMAISPRSEPVLAALPGGFATRRKGTGQEVADVRSYVHGDDIRHLDRGTTARTGQLHIRQFQEERDRVTLLVADFRASMFWGITRAFRSVAAAEALALIGWRVVEDGGRVGLLALTPEAPVLVPARGRMRGMLDVIGGLVRAHGLGLDMVMQGQAQGGDTPLDQALKGVKRLCPPGSEVVIASGFDTEGPSLADRLDELARRRTPALILITDAVPERLPKGRYPIRLGDGRRTQLVLGGAPPDRESRHIAGRAALRLDAGSPVDSYARQIAAAFPMSERT